MPLTVVLSDIVKPDLNKNEAILSERTNLFPRSVNVRRQLVQEALAQIEVDITVPNPTSFMPTYLIVRNADGLNFTVAFHSSVQEN